MNKLFAEAQAVIPGGVNSPVRAFKAVGGEPIFIERAKGAYLYDSDGKRYVDYVLSWGPMILGHADDDVLEAVKVSVNPKVINTPRVAAMAKDGIQLIAIARVTVRANINRLVGGAGEDTILARVGEGIVSTIGSSASHKAVLENPDAISKTVLGKGLDSGTAYEILSIDIADVDVGKNIGAELQTDQAEADKRIAQAKAEERRAMAVAAEQEMKAKVVEMRARVVEAEAEVPMAMAEAFRSGNLGIMDYVRYRNVNADTDMRNSIAREGGTGETGNGQGS